MTFLYFIYLLLKDIGMFLNQELLRMTLPLPMMRYREINIIKEVIANTNPERVLEWGCGYSTLYFSKILGDGASWLSIDHNPHWMEKIERRNKNPNVSIHYVKPENPERTDEFRNGGYSDLAGYLEFPTDMGKFDLILIDGRARKECLIKAKELVAGNGIVILHDANRVSYHEPLKEYKSQEFFLDSRTTGYGIWLGSNERDIGSLIDVPRHQKLWKHYKTKFAAKFRI